MTLEVSVGIMKSVWEIGIMAISVANGGLFSAKWLILKIFGGQKKWLISHQNVAYFYPSKWLKVA